MKKPLLMFIKEKLKQNFSFNYVNVSLVAVLLLGSFFVANYAYNYCNNTINTRSVETNIKNIKNDTSDIKKIDSPKNSLLWGAYVGDGVDDLANFERLVGKKINLYADFEGWDNNFPLNLSSTVGEKGKTLIIFWEPSFGYDVIINGVYDDYIKQFAGDAKKYSYPIVLVPFDEMNLNEEAWGYGQNKNTALKFKAAWVHVHDLFTGVSNVRFGLAFNNISIPLVDGNKFSDYYPGDNYVDYVGVDGFSLSQSWQTFGQIFDGAIKQLNIYDKPIFIFSIASESDSRKADWIRDGLGSKIKGYKNIIGWVWFNQGGSPNWKVDSDSFSLKAFKEILP